jgi:peptide deformylase
VFVYDWTDDDGERHRGVAVNPELWIAPLPLGELDDDAESEGCLSIPGERFPLRRSPAAILRAVDLDQKPFEVHADGWLARIFQHEYDHLDGVLYADRLEHPHSKNAAKAIKKRSWGSPGQSWLPGRDDLEG